MAVNNCLAISFAVSVSLLASCGIGGLKPQAGCDSQTASAFFGDSWNTSNEQLHAGLQLHFDMLSLVNERGLNCAQAPDQAIRVSRRSAVEPSRFVARLTGDQNQAFRALSYKDPDSANVHVLSDRGLTADEWSKVWAIVSEIDLETLRVIPIVSPRPTVVFDDTSTLFEIRNNSQYHAAIRGTRNMEPQLARLLSTLIELSGMRSN